jgi:hypothetical protein
MVGLDFLEFWIF